MKAVIGLNRFDDDRLAVANSTGTVALDIMTRKRPAEDPEALMNSLSDVLGDAEVIGDADGDGEEEVHEENEDLSVDTQNIAPTPRRTNSSITPLSSSPYSSSGRRTPKGSSAGPLGDLGESLRQLGASKNEWKRAKHSEVETTRRLEISKKYEFETMTFRFEHEREVKIRELALEERRMHLEEVKYGIYNGGGSKWPLSINNDAQNSGHMEQNSDVNNIRVEHQNFN